MTPLRPAILFGLRTAASGMLALYIAFALQIDQPGWAATSAIIVAQPVLGASLRKGSFRLIGTLAGAVFSVLLYAAFPQDRIGFLAGLALWGGACSFVSTYLREFASYAAMLAGYTAAIITMDAVGSPQDVFLLAVARDSAIAIGIACTGVVFSLTDLGRQRAELAQRIETIAAQVLDGMRGVLAADPEPMDRQRDRRRALVVSVAALDTVVDQALGENYDLRSRVDVLRAALTGLFTALSCWRGLEQHVRRLAPEERRSPAAAAAALDRALPRGLAPSAWHAAGEALLAAPTVTASDRLLADRLGDGLLGLAAAQDGVTLLRDPRRAAAVPGQRALHVSDWLTAAVNGLRSVLVVGLAEVVWVFTGWTSGPVFVTFAMVVVTLFVLREDAAFGGAAVMAAGAAWALLAAGVVKFALLPLVQGWGFDGYPAFAAVVGGLVFLAAFAAAAQRQGTTLAALTFATMANFMPLFSPTNAQTYDYAGFLNGAIAIVGGACFGAAGYRWLPAPTPAWRIRRAIAATRRDLRRLLAGRLRVDERGWARLLYVRLVQMPPQATLPQHAQVLAALSVGTEVLRSRALQRRAAASPVEAMRLAVARREIAEAVASHPHFFAGLKL
jgi:uncharacterized membrane protein YccC